MLQKIKDRLKRFRTPSLQDRFLLRVLAPPFIILLLISIIGFWQLDSMARESAKSDLKRASATTAAKLEREFALRETILKSTGNELFTTKSDYQAKRDQLATSRTACKTFVAKNKEFSKAPNDTCKPFFAQFAVASPSDNLQQVVEKAYEAQIVELGAREKEAINDRLDAFVGVFPETLHLIVTDEKGDLLSQASSSEEQEQATTKMTVIAAEALKKPIEGRYLETGQKRQLIFAYPITKGAVLASYDLDHSNFMRQSWQDAPIDQSKSYAVIADSASMASYPKLDNDSLYHAAIATEEPTGSTTLTSYGIQYLTVVDAIGTTDWTVVVGTPSVTALQSLAAAQIAAVGIIGFLLVSFLWMGALFVQRTVRSILGLVSGSILFAQGNLEYRIDTAKMGDEEFESLAKVMNEMAGKIQEAEKEIEQKNKEFISVATHEIKAPMTAIIGNLSMVIEDQMGKQDEMARVLTLKAYDGTIRLRDLVNELLDIARLESGRARYSFERVSLGAEIRAMVELQELPAQEKSITVNQQIPDQLPLVATDKKKLEIILTNFISNAIKYNRSPGVVAISCEIKGNFIQTTITDTGLGIPADQQEHMFQKFFRVEASDRRDIPGTGLGMYITKQFIEAMGGKLWFESETGKGTSFHFTLPIADAVVQSQNTTPQV
jgi:signal transduction histidine kinase